MKKYLLFASLLPLICLLTAWRGLKNFQATQGLAVPSLSAPFLLLVAFAPASEATAKKDQSEYPLASAAAKPVETATAPLEDASYLEDILRSLGAARRADTSPRPGGSLALGEQIVTKGIGHNGKRQSKHFVCISCHNVVPEDPNFLSYDPAARLEYAVEHDLPFLPGTTLYGAVNRKSYYNGDYDKKYGDLVKSARKDLRAAIQLCATECAQGRPLDNNEMESVLLYLQKIGLQLGDLQLTATEKKQVDTALTKATQQADSPTGAQAAAIAMLTSKFAAASPATFVLPPENRNEGYPLDRKLQPAVGKEIYSRSCLHCHEKQQFAFFELAEEIYHYDFLLKHFPRYTRYSTYQVVRYGTSPIPGKKAYMPHYTAERMSHQQVEDLKAYLQQAATAGR